MPRPDAADRSAEDRTASGRPAPSSQGSVEQTVARAALDLVNDLTGPDGVLPPGSLTFSRPSLDHVDEVLGALHEKWLASDRTGLAVPADVRNAFASYVGEVARKEFGGKYRPGDKDNPFWLVVGDAGSRVRVGVCSGVTARVLDGAERSVAEFYDRIGPALAEGTDGTVV